MPRKPGYSDPNWEDAQNYNRDIGRVTRATEKSKQASIQQTRRVSGEVARANSSHRAAKNLELRQGSEKVRQETLAKRTALRNENIQYAAQTRVATQEQEAANRRNQRMQNAVIFGAGNSSIGSAFALIAGLFLVMTIVYMLVKNGDAWGGVFSSVGSFIHGLSSSTPLFQKKSTTSSTSNSDSTSKTSSTTTPTTG